MKKLISIVSPCFNESENIERFYSALITVLDQLIEFDFEIIFIDNASTDNTVGILKTIAVQDKRLKIICNIRNFGQVRSPYWGLLQSKGLATILIASDLQDPPEVIPQLMNEWLLGWKVVMARKPKSETNFFIHQLRRLYYKFLRSVSDFEVIEDANGFGLYDSSVIQIIKSFNDPYPYLRGLVGEIGFPIKSIDYIQKDRQFGKSKSNFLHLYDVAMLGLINNSTLPLRITAMIGFTIALASFCCVIFFVLMKIIHWENYSAGSATIISAIFFLFGLLFCFLGILGEYVASIFIQVRNRPPVIEKERINF